MMDLDHFKEINDGLGHHAGDQLLKLIGPRLKPLLDASLGEIARLGGDEFAVIIRRAGDEDDDPRDGRRTRRRAARAIPGRDAASRHRRIDRRGDLSRAWQ